MCHGEWIGKGLPIPSNWELAILSNDFVDKLSKIVGRRHVLTRASATHHYCTGYRFGGGKCVAVIRPGTLLEQWRVLEACVAADVIIISQAANTGLTGGSTPNGNAYDREVVIISTCRIRDVQVILGGQQVVCLAGATLYGLERALKPFDREPHSVIGSSCIGASVVGGICNNSGGALVRRGPAYTELALFAQVDTQGQLKLVNHLGIELGERAEEVLTRLERADYCLEDIDVSIGRNASDMNYGKHVRDVEASSPARFNADPTRLFEASGCAGKICVFAVRLDTFEAEKNTQIFYIGTNNPDDLTKLRYKFLSDHQSLPIAAEYMHCDAFDIAAVYGKDMFVIIRGMGFDHLPFFFSLKSTFDRWWTQLTGQVGFSDRVLQKVASVFPQHLPKRMRDFRDRFEHHLILQTGGAGVAEARRYLASEFPMNNGGWFECDEMEGDKAFLHRFVMAGAAVRYRAIHSMEVEDIVALDAALPRNNRDWVEFLPATILKQIVAKLYYGHFFCHVFHQDYLVKKGSDPLIVEEEILGLLNARGAECPAEHNVGHLYEAKPILAAHYRGLDPVNSFNSGIGKTSKRKNWL